MKVTEEGKIEVRRGTSIVTRLVSSQCSNKGPMFASSLSGITTIESIVFVLFRKAEIDPVEPLIFLLWGTLSEYEALSGRPPSIGKTILENEFDCKEINSTWAKIEPTL